LSWVSAGYRDEEELVVDLFLRGALHEHVRHDVLFIGLANRHLGLFVLLPREDFVALHRGAEV
jgi:hypothetical protein